MRRAVSAARLSLLAIAPLALQGCAWLERGFHHPPQEAAASAVTATMPEAKYCARPAEKTASDVVGLKTWLMVVALTCKERPGYNAFVTTQRGNLTRHEAVLSDYFRRNYGRQATTVHDDYITQLANLLSQQSLRQGTAFCANSRGAFADVKSVRGEPALADYATAHAPAQPERFSLCQVTAQP